MLRNLLEVWWDEAFDTFPKGQLYWQSTLFQSIDSSHSLIPHHLHPGGNRKPGLSYSVLQSRQGCYQTQQEESCFDRPHQ